MRKETCQDCAGLVNDEGSWICDELDMAIEEIDECPEGLSDMIHFEIFIQDLTDECREQLEEVIGKEHNYDVLPLATLEFERGGNS